MGGFSSQVQQPQASQPTSGKGGANAVGQALPQQAIPIPNQMSEPIAESVAQPAVMPQGGGGKGQRNYEQRPDGLDQNAINANPQGFQQWQQQRSQQPAQYSPPGNTMSGKGSSTNSATSGQPRMGQPNNYANTIPQWDNASQQLTQPAKSSGKGKGG
jgi:hypothetical protein